MPTIRMIVWSHDDNDNKFSIGVRVKIRIGVRVRGRVRGRIGGRVRIRIGGRVRAYLSIPSLTLILNNDTLNNDTLNTKY